MRLLFFLAILSLLSCDQQNQPGFVERPNVLFIAIDDMNHWTSLYDDSNPIKTPNLNKIASEGIFFNKAYCNSPACNPSRTSILSGLRPSTTGVYGNASSWRDVLSPSQLLPAYFKQNGYQTFTAGKIFHHQKPEHADYTVFDEALPFPAWPPDAPMPPELLNGMRMHYYRSGDSIVSKSPNFDWGVWPSKREDYIDQRTSDWVVKHLKHMDKSKPFFMAAGIFRPHAPTFAPQEFFDMYPLSEIQMPELKEDDLDDIPEEALKLLHRPNYAWFSTLRHYVLNKDSLMYKKAVQGYMAASSFCDYQVGLILQGLEEAGFKENTIVVIWSDHGYFLGQKERWEKFALYEQSTHVPLIFRAPGISGGSDCEAPVSLIDIYPTLLDLCNLPENEWLEGTSLKKYLIDPASSGDRPVIITYEKNNHSIRSDDYRYNRYANGAEELYHTTEDPHEWVNLSGDIDHRKMMDSLSQWIPILNANQTRNALP